MLIDLAGLDVYINRTERLYTTLEVDGQPITMSRADFWALAGIEAVYYAHERAIRRGSEEHPPDIKHAFNFIFVSHFVKTN